MTFFENTVLNQIFHLAPETIVVITFLILLLRKASGRKGAMSPPASSWTVIEDPIWSP